jgi:hypothetical protein
MNYRDRALYLHRSSGAKLDPSDVAYRGRSESRIDIDAERAAQKVRVSARNAARKDTATKASAPHPPSSRSTRAVPSTVTGDASKKRGGRKVVPGVADDVKYVVLS